MKVISPGTQYELENFGSDNGTQVIRFTERSGDTYIKGTTNEEVIDMMINRFYTLQEKKPSPENQVVILLLKNARRMMASRLSRKIKKVKRIDETTEDLP